MSKDSQNTLKFASVSGKKVEAAFDGGHLTSDAGVLFLRATDRRLSLIDTLSKCLSDGRHKSYVSHSLPDLMRQRVFQIACGYEDANDCNSLRSDPAFKMSCDRLPESGADLASQPTMSRLENRIRPKELYRLARAFAALFIASYAKAPEGIILDIDDTCDTVHGNQQLSLFNGYYDEHCFLPLHIYEGQSGKLITTLLRPGKRPTGPQIVSILKRLVSFLRSHWPKVSIILRGDSHFSCPEVHDYCEAKGLFYVLGQTGNAKLDALGGGLLAKAATLTKAKGQPIRLFRSFMYQAKSWAKPRRIVFKAEMTEKGANPRYVATNLTSSQAGFIYEQIYCARGRMEGFIKNHKSVLRSDRTSCHRFEANQFRLLLHSAAYVLIHALVTVGLTSTQWAHAQFDTIQKGLLKVAARIQEIGTKIKVQLPVAFPLKAIYERLCLSFAQL